MNKITFVLLLLWTSGTHPASAVYIHLPEDMTTVHNQTAGRGVHISACGVPAIKPNVPQCPRDGLGIINGEQAVPHSWPWQVSLQTYAGVHFCGGSLINKDWVVTAAHCEVSESRRVILGEYNLESNYNIQSLMIGKVFTHPNYNEQNYWDYDIALIKLKSPAQMDKHVSPVCVVNTGDHIPGGTKCVVTGWGSIRSNPAQSPAKLQQACLPTISHSQCQSYWPRGAITYQMFCAGAAGSSTCQGDSGGPLVCMKNGAWTLYGITSWGGQGCPTNRPGVYTAVTNLRAWMDRTMANN